MPKYTLDFKYRAVLHTTKIHSQQRTTWHFNVSRTHLCRWVATYWQGGITALQHLQTVSVKIKPKNRLSPANPITKKQAEPIEDWRDMRVEKGCTDRERNGAKHVAQRHVGKMCRWKVVWERWKRRASIKKLCYRWQTDRGHRWWHSWLLQSWTDELKLKKAEFCRLQNPAWKGRLGRILNLSKCWGTVYRFRRPCCMLNLILRPTVVHGSAGRRNRHHRWFRAR